MTDRNLQTKPFGMPIGSRPFKSDPKPKVPGSLRIAAKVFVINGIGTRSARRQTEVSKSQSQERESERCYVAGQSS